MNCEAERSLEHWNKVHNSYKRAEIKTDNWLEDFSRIISSCSTPIIDLGCGSGNDTLYLIQKGKKVISCDQSPNAISNIKSNFPEVFDTRCFNMLDGFPFDDHSTELIIADLCLHYFREKDTFNIINEIKRVLSPDGHLILRVNSINDINYGAGRGIEIEKHLFMTDDNRLKRFFCDDDLQYFFRGFKFLYSKEETMNRHDLEKRLYKVCLKKSIF
ncbi:MAG: class I SAM-dependent methyltransferase [Lachnospiraceae bacterium]|nr:class I SAM-dependent methyltransferase [Lachnospiraceae bacterium]